MQILGTNKLNSVAGYSSYTYDDLGQLKSAQQANVPFGMYLKYDVTGKITGVYADAALTQLKIAYSYDESGNRISRTDNTSNYPVTSYYIYDPFGTTIAMYNETNLTDMPIYGADKLGTYIFNNNYIYELRDNVGSVRVVINRNKRGDGTADIVQYNDYYPFGSIAQSGGTGYRYEYQGAYAEKDPVTGFNNFELRMYDGKIGRWLSTDPMGQYASPYEGMGNNPVIGSDPTGGFDDINYDTKSGSTTTTTTKDDFNRYFVDGKYQGWAGKGTGGLQWFQNGGFGIPDYFNPVGDFNKGFISNTVVVNGGGANWMSFAKGELGQTEIPGMRNNSRVIDYLHSTDRSFNNDEIAWCSAFVNWSMNASGHRGTNSARAFSWKTWGQKLDGPAYGAVAVMSFSHVGYVAGVNSNGSIVILGGNQGQPGQVNLSSMKPKLIVSYRYPNGEAPNYSLPHLNVHGRSLSFNTTH